MASVPASTGLGVTSLLTNSISATGSTVTVAVSSLFVLLVSPVSNEYALAVFTSVPSAIGLATVMVTFTSSFTAISSKSHTTSALVIVQFAPTLSVTAVNVVAGLPFNAETYWGIVSLNSTDCPTSIPIFLTFTV